MYLNSCSSADILISQQWVHSSTMRIYFDSVRNESQNGWRNAGVKILSARKGESPGMEDKCICSSGRGGGNGQWVDRRRKALHGAAPESHTSPRIENITMNLMHLRSLHALSFRWDWCVLGTQLCQTEVVTSSSYLVVYLSVQWVTSNQVPW